MSSEPEPGRADPLADKVRALPEEPGVYLFKDARGKVLYVGKAKTLRDRVRSYLAPPADLAPKTRVLMGRARDLDYIAVHSEVEALVLECNLIKEYRPRYNIRLRDDKQYPYIRVTIDPFPRLFATRTLVHDGSEYFGPYTDVGAMRRTLALLQRVFPTRPCSRRASTASTGRASTTTSRCAAHRAWACSRGRITSRRWKRCGSSCTGAPTNW